MNSFIRLISSRSNQLNKFNRCFTCSFSRPHASLSATETVGNSSRINIFWTNDKKYEFSAIFLRDNCLCNQCYDSKVFEERKIDLTQQIPLNLQASRTWIEGNNLFVEWDDGHQSKFSSEKLEELTSDKKSYQFELFDSSFVPERYEFEKMLKDWSYMKEFWKTVKINGIGLIEGAPQYVGQLKRLGEAMQHLRKTHHELIFDVKNDPKATNIAYTNIRLKPHTDLPYYEHVPGLLLLHSIKNAKEGGESFFVDGFKAAKVLQEESPSSYDIMTKKKIVFQRKLTSVDKPFNIWCRRNIIETDDFGSPKHIAYDEWTRNCFQFSSADESMQFYKAYYEFSKILERPWMIFYHKLTPGECIVADNKRTLHAREGFPKTEERFYQGAYMDWDAVNSFINVN